MSASKYGGRLGGEHQHAVVERDPPQVTREVDDLGARRFRHLDVPGLGNAGQLGDHRIGVLDVLEHVRADDVVEDLIGEWHVARRWRRTSADRLVPPMRPSVGRHARRRCNDRAARRLASAACRRCRRRARARCDRPVSRFVADRTSAAAARGSWRAPMEQSHEPVLVALDLAEVVAQHLVGHVRSEVHRAVRLAPTIPEAGQDHPIRRRDLRRQPRARGVGQTRDPSR